jgi:hypothetical protein
MKTEEEFTEARVRRHELRVEGRAYATACPSCFLAGLQITTTKKGGFHLQCFGCGQNGFLAKADLAWPLIGCGEGLRRLPFAELKTLRLSVSRRGRRLIAEENWTLGQYGRDVKDTRPVLKWAVSCFGCGEMNASLRRDVRGRGYTTCARGCLARIFFPEEASMRRFAGWSDLRAETGAELWNQWFTEGRTVWGGWCAPLAMDGAEEAASEDRRVTSKEA